MTAPRPALERAWRASLVVFALAGLTGALFRWVVAQGWATGLHPVNVRHAHSHLMYFGWATPALMALVAAHVEQATGRRMRGVGAVLAAVFGLALLAYPPFLLWGYAPAVLGGTRLPLSVMAAGFNVLGWYGFVILYAHARRQGFGGPAAQRFDLALGLLVLATLGAWGLALSQPLGVATEALSAALTHLFLDVFGEGWFVVGVLALAYAAAETGGARSLSHHPLFAVAAGVPFTFALAMPAGLVPPLWKGLAGVGSGLVGAALLATVVMLWPRLRSGLWRVALALLAVKAVGQIAVALVPGVHWAALAGLRVLYLHLMLLGFVTLGLAAAARGAGLPTHGASGLAALVGVLLATLVPLTGFWPAALGGAWVFIAAALAALGPPLAALFMATGGARVAPATGTAGR